MTRRRWTEAEDATLRARYPHELTREIAADLGRTTCATYERAQKLGIHKAPGFLGQGPDRSGAQASTAGRFQPGHRTWNKGVSYQAGGRSAETRFKPGLKTHTWRPVGSERIRYDGYRERKIMDTGYPPRDWVPVHRLLWEERHGPVPPGHVVVFRNGDKTDIRADNLECVTRAEVAHRNRIWTRYPREVAEAQLLRGAIKRRLREIRERQEDSEG